MQMLKENHFFVVNGPQMKIKKSSYQVLKKERISDQTFLLHTERPDVPVKAGQCFSVGTQALGINREYSIYSGADDSCLTFLIRELEDGIVSPALGACEEGSHVEIGGPYGEFCLYDEHIKERSFVFIASGTGIAPFHSFVKTYPELDYTIIHGIRYEDEAYEQDHYIKNRYIPCVSRPRVNGAQSLRVTDYIRQSELNMEAVYYLCGNRKMITDVIPLLLTAGVSGDHIFTETFF